MANYKPNRGNVRRWLDSDGDLRAAVRDKADTIADRARRIAPVHSGRYKASIRVRTTHAWDGRVAADVTADVPYATIVEKGRRSIHNRGHHTLRRAAEMLFR